MKSLKEFLNEASMKDSILKLKKLGGEVFANAAINSKTNEVATLGVNGKIWFLIKADGKFIRGKSKKEVLGKDWVLQKISKSQKQHMSSLMNKLQGGQNDGDVVDMLLNLGYSLKDINKAARNLGSKNIEDFLDR